MAQECLVFVQDVARIPSNLNEVPEHMAQEWLPALRTIRIRPPQ